MENQKKPYKKPTISVTEFDHVTSAVLMSLPPGPLGDPVSLPPPPTQS
ncbi:MAG: hypothetical protein LAT75_09105 [Candidatus Cyclonatronum sp.]|nr:hypothetical protein [Cyclonatronum sp.]MCC5935220.1 hypothetical protein [Balneolales bacterium]MCH8487013.1 hypothetical protein [Cyclonatronum sp.]